MNQQPQRISRGMVQPAFLFVSGLLLLSAIAFNGFVWNMKLHFKKEAVPQPRAFRELPPVMGRWVQVSLDDKLDKETEDVLGTENYIYRDYIQLDRAGADFVALMALKSDVLNSTALLELDPASQRAEDVARAKYNSARSDAAKIAIINASVKGRTSTDRKAALSRLEMRNHAGDVVHMGLTYYTGLVDTVAHIPDRCYIADGYEPNSYTTPTWNLSGGAAGVPLPLKVRLISFDDATGNNRISKCVAYVFHANGLYTCDPLEVRRILEDLQEKYGYYAKIELMEMVPSVNDADVANASSTMADFLSSTRSEIEGCLPDWAKLKRLHPKD